jgi:hypothetical protein
MAGQLHEFLLRLKALFRKQRMEREMADELDDLRSDPPPTAYVPMTQEDDMAVPIVRLSALRGLRVLSQTLPAHSSNSRIQQFLRQP